ncbi:hypothetical protein Afil01_49770 [Actinorhabdospora filicis]|uniref:DNA-binding transcriptional regulator of glucitol operon n=1 Tax=Actinorhabdospora filicis TaxID=1785913 RepID=A0A9W6SNJ9_9ACTN|nr:hypothetical protein [Actinorhabdospora filicis]GLZ80170.1 hypothetical protein Afil01_49770 [Actinorhabdospora filicis]
MARFFTRRWIFAHTALVVVLAAFAWLAWWQIGRAAGGNALSWAYAFEWPLFGLCAIALWIREIRQELRKNGPLARPEDPPMESPFETKATYARPASGDDELSAYNEYLAWMNENPDRRASDYPGRQNA